MCPKLRNFRGKMVFTMKTLICCTVKLLAFYCQLHIHKCVLTYNIIFIFLHSVICLLMYMRVVTCKKVLAKCVSSKGSVWPVHG